MRAMRAEATCDKVVDVIAVRERFVPAACALDVPLRMVALYAKLRALG